jgi:polyhydroxybutyrate depolymerase
MAATGGWLLGGLLLAAGCGDEDVVPDDDAGEVSDAGDHDAGSAGDAGADSASDERISSGCSGGDLSPGDHDTTLSFGGKSRAYLLHVPPSYSGRPMPVVINLHGFLSNYTEQPDLTHMSAQADSEGFIVAYPNGAGDPTAWNAGDCCEFKETDRDDVGFVAALLDELEDKGCVDLTREYVTGFSNGGFLAHSVGCELSERVAAIATVAGVLGVPPEECKPARAMPVLQIHGDADGTVPYGGGSPTGWELLYPGTSAPTFRSAVVTADFWREKSGCAADQEQSFKGDDTDCESYKSCEHGNEVTLCTISGGGHIWPNGDPSALKAMVVGIPVSSLVGKVPTFDANGHIWSFFKAHPLP